MEVSGDCYFELFDSCYFDCKCELMTALTDFQIHAEGVLQMLGKAQLELQKIVDAYVSA